MQAAFLPTFWTQGGAKRGCSVSSQGVHQKLAKKLILVHKFEYNPEFVSCKRSESRQPLCREGLTTLVAFRDSSNVYSFLMNDNVDHYSFWNNYVLLHNAKKSYSSSNEFKYVQFRQSDSSLCAAQQFFSLPEVVAI